MAESLDGERKRVSNSGLRRYTYLIRVSRPLGWVIAPLVFLFGLYFSRTVFSNIKTPVIIYYFLFCSALLLIAVVIPSEKLSQYLLKLIFAGFIVAAAVYLKPFLLG